ncbi:hypothetical protein HPP92_004987 [Vanilla planifolia]|uniref:N-acetyltransferase domain-containing protein n=1 Tax=Vanilla planifolia TaxID=51239 RepID=A0A835RNU9_VANPL|nr:hypothetical protein HPP92_004987 [Vanilla planifolia]
MHAYGHLRHSHCFFPSIPPPAGDAIPKHASPICCTAQYRSNPNLPFSVSDDELEARGLRVRRSAAGLDPEALNSVFARVGFPRREASRIRAALDHTDAVVWIEEEAGRGKGGASGIRARDGDGVFNAVVWDVVVEPEVQGTGLGRAVMERLVADLRARGIRNIALYAEPRVVGFYRPLGFAADPDGIKGMVYSRRTKKTR